MSGKSKDSHISYPYSLDAPSCQSALFHVIYSSKIMRVDFYTADDRDKLVLAEPYPLRAYVLFQPKIIYCFAQVNNTQTRGRPGEEGIFLGMFGLFGVILDELDTS